MTAWPLPEYAFTRRYPLPWPTSFGDAPLTTLPVMWQRTAYRTYGPGGAMQMGRYATDAPLNATCALACSRWSFNHQTQAQFEAVVRAILHAVTVYRIAPVVGAQAPADLPLPSGYAWPLSIPVADFLDLGTGDLVAPRGVAAAFRLLPASAYDGGSGVSVGVFRGDHPPED